MVTMRLNTWIPLGLAIVMGLVAAILARGVLAGRKAADAPAPLRVVVAKATLAPGDQIGADDVTLGTVTGDARPDGAFADLSQVTGRVLTAQLVKGQVVLDALLASPGATAGLQNLVPAGMRLITVEVNEFSSVAGMLAPGCRVDILASMSDPQTKEMMARTIVENVKVQAVGQRLGARATGAEGEGPPNDPAAAAAAAFRSVTLQVAPQEAEAIHVASTAGRPWMVLRAPNDHTASRSPGVSLAELRGNPRPDKPAEFTAHAGVFTAKAATTSRSSPVAAAEPSARAEAAADDHVHPRKTEIAFVDDHAAPTTSPIAARSAGQRDHRRRPRPGGGAVTHKPRQSVEPIQVEGEAARHDERERTTRSDSARGHTARRSRGWRRRCSRGALTAAAAIEAGRARRRARLLDDARPTAPATAATAATVRQRDRPGCGRGDRGPAALMVNGSTVVTTKPCTRPSTSPTRTWSTSTASTTTRSS